MAFSIRYAIPMKGPGCGNSVTTKLKSLKDVDSVEVNLSLQEVVVVGTAPPSKIVSSMQTIGRDAFIRGSGEPNSAAVAILETKEGHVKGLARIIEIVKGTTLFDITVDKHFIGDDVGIYSFGDISDPPTSLGEKLFNISDLVSAARQSDKDQPTVSAWSTHHNIPLLGLIGRSIHTSSGLTGIIARSAGLWENDKAVCTCSGKTVWEERNDFREKTSGNL